MDSQDVRKRSGDMRPESSTGSRAREAAGEGEPYIEYVRLDGLPPAPRNAKQHDRPAIRRSFRKFGFVNPPIINEATGNLVAGHGRIEVLTEDHRRKRKPPKRVRVEADGMWAVPVVRGIRFDSDEDAELYVLADNKLQQRAGYDDELLAEMLRDHDQYDLEIAGFDEDEVDKILEASDDAADDDEGGDGSSKLGGAGLLYRVVVDCAGESAQAKLIERLEEEGFKCVPLIS